MSTTEVILLARPSQDNYDQIRSTLARLHHDYRHVAIKELDPDQPDGHLLAMEHGVNGLPALIVDGRLRLAGEMPERDIRRAIEKAKHAYRC